MKTEQVAGRIISVNLSARQGERKQPVAEGLLVAGQGLAGDGHATGAIRQVSLLALESIRTMQAKGAQVGPGDFAENLTTEGIDLPSLPLGTVLAIGDEGVRLAVAQIGKVCHDRCSIFEQVGDCVMPREGIFARVLVGGPVKQGHSIRALGADRESRRAFAVLTVSDRSARGQRADQSGPAIAELLGGKGWELVAAEVVPDEREEIAARLCRYADELEVPLVLTTGGTGLAPRDVTPEATLAVIERQAPGIAEAIRAASLSFTPHAILSRAVSGIRRATLIVNLPGSPKAVREALAVILPALPHAAELLQGAVGDCGSGPIPARDAGPSDQET